MPLCRVLRIASKSGVPVVTQMSVKVSLGGEMTQVLPTPEQAVSQSPPWVESTQLMPVAPQDAALQAPAERPPFGNFLAEESS